MSHFVFKAGFTQLTGEEMDILKLDVSNHEIHVVVKHMGAFKAPERIAFKQFSTKVGESILDNFQDRIELNLSMRL